MPLNRWHSLMATNRIVRHEFPNFSGTTEAISTCSCVVGDLLGEVRVLTADEWDALPSQERPRLAAYFEGFGWVCIYYHPSGANGISDVHGDSADEAKLMNSLDQPVIWVERPIEGETSWFAASAGVEGSIDLDNGLYTWAVWRDGPSDVLARGVASSLSLAIAGVEDAIARVANNP